VADPRDEDAPPADPGDRTPPHDLLAEQSALGSMLLSRDAVDAVVAEVRGPDFYIPKHEIVFAAISALTGRGEPVDVITVTAELNKSGQIGRAGGAEYLHTLTGIPSTTANAGFHAGIIADLAKRRRMIEAGTRVVQMGYASEGATDDLIETARAEVDAVQGLRRHPLRMIGEALPKLAATLEEKPKYLPTPWASIDTLIGGFAPGELCVIAARPGEGKSIALLQAALKAARHGVVAFSSLEMSFEQLQLRMVSQFGEVHMTALRNHDLSEQDWNRLGDAAKLTSGAPVFVDDAGAGEMATIGTIRSHARAVAKRGTLAAIFVDYVQLIDGPGENRVRELDGVSRGLAQLAAEFNVPVVAAAQLNRGQQSRGNARPEPTLRDLRESGGIEANATAVMLLHRDAEKRPNDLDVIVAKNRQGRIGKVTLRWQPEYARIVDRDWRSKLWGDDTEEME
jgi:replicative DNA helicase